MTVAINKLIDGTIELTIGIPWPEVKKTYNRFFETALEAISVSGFRKGKAPKEIAREKVDKTKVYEEVIKEIVPKSYTQAIRENNLKPIVSPKIELTKAKEDEDWQLKASFCEKPIVNLGNYRQSVSAVNKKTQIWVPGKDKESQKETDQKGKNFGEIIEVLEKGAKVAIPHVLIDEEVNRMLANFLDELRKLGLTVEQYLSSKGKTIEQLRQEYRVEAEKSLTLEFILEEVAEKENVTVSPQEIEEVVNKAKPQEKSLLSERRYLLASLLRRQKTLDKLLNL